MARILSRRSDAAPPAAPEGPADPPTAVEPAPDAPTEVVDAVAPDEAAQETAVHEAAIAETSEPPVVDPETVPAGADAPPAAQPSFIARGKLRRRLRYLRRVRELGFRDLGGLVFDLNRFGGDRPDLVELKLAGLRSIDGELRAIEVALDDLPEADELFEPGVAACAACGAIQPSDANFCPSCGTATNAPPPAVEPPADEPPAA